MKRQQHHILLSALMGVLLCSSMAHARQTDIVLMMTDSQSTVERA